MGTPMGSTSAIFSLASLLNRSQLYFGRPHFQRASSCIKVNRKSEKPWISISYRTLKRTLPADNRVWDDNKGKLWKKIKTQSRVFFHNLPLLLRRPCYLPLILNAYPITDLLHDKQNLSHEITLCFYFHTYILLSDGYPICNLSWLFSDLGSRSITNHKFALIHVFCPTTDIFFEEKNGELSMCKKCSDTSFQVQ